MSLAEQAATIAIDHRIRSCDAVYVTLAAQLGDCLVTLDRQQLERAAEVVDAREPRAAPTGPEQ
jgi:predicted nucleic acid-binding protein